MGHSHFIVNSDIYRHLSYNNEKGFVNYLCTLCLDELSFPIYLSDGTSLDVPNSLILDDFFSNLAVRLADEFKIGFDGAYPPINFFVFPENDYFGRIHYHVLLGVSNVISNRILYDMVVKYWPGDAYLYVLDETKFKYLAKYLCVLK